MHVWFYVLKPPYFREMDGFDKGNDERGCYYETNSNEINSHWINSQLYVSIKRD